MRSPSLFEQLFKLKPASYFCRVGAAYSNSQNAPYVELFRFPQQHWFGTLHYLPAQKTELTLWNSSCIIYESTKNNTTSLSIKVLHVTNTELPLSVDDIHDELMGLWLTKSDSHITYASGFSFK